MQASKHDRAMSRCREVADDSKAQSDGTSLADKPEIILERLGFARPRQQQLVSASPCWTIAAPSLRCCCTTAFSLLLPARSSATATLSLNTPITNVVVHSQEDALTSRPASDRNVMQVLHSCAQCWRNKTSLACTALGGPCAETASTVQKCCWPAGTS